MSNTYLLRSGIALVMAGIFQFGFFAPTSVAQTDQDEPRIEDKVIVTGTRIARPDANAASPVVSFDEQALAEFAQQGVEDFLNELPYVVPDQSKSAAASGEGNATVNLRGLGPTRTLVLLNGRRVAPTGGSRGIGGRATVDLNLIPASLLERVDVVTGGASAVYGSDAIAGAVNFILDDDFEGIEIGARYDVYGAGDGESYGLDVSGGRRFARGRGHISGYAEYHQRAELLATERDFTRTTISEDPATGALGPSGSTIVEEGVIVFPAANINGAFGLPIFNSDGSVRPFVFPDDLNDPASSFPIQTGLERWSGGAFADYDVSDGTKLYTELMYSRARTDLRYTPPNARAFVGFSISPTFFPAETQAILSQNYDLDGDGIGTGFVIKQFSELGDLDVPRVAESLRGVWGAETQLASDWKLDGYFSYGLNKSDYTIENGGIVLSRFQQALLVDPATGGCPDPSNGCVPANIFGTGNLSESALDFITSRPLVNELETEQQIVSLTANGSLFDLPAGTVQAAGGVEYRSDSFKLAPDPLFATRDIAGFSVSQSDIDAEIDVYEVFGEVVVPILVDEPFANLLEFEAGARYSEYSTSGGVWTWKAGGQWAPLDNLRVRGMWQRAVRAPGIDELFAPENPLSFQLTPGTDFCLAINDPVGNSVDDICVAQGMDASQLGVYGAAGSGLETASLPIDVINRGNPDLEPERADTLTFGADYTFSGPYDVRVGANYFAIELEDAIEVVGDLLGVCLIEGDPDAPVCQATTRAPSGLPTSAVSQPLNIAEARVEGWDLNLEVKGDAPAWMSPESGADISLNTILTHYTEFGNAVSQSSPFIDCAGGFENRCSAFLGTTFPDTFITSTLRYDTDRFGISLQSRWFSGIDNLSPVFDGLAGITSLPPAISSVGDKHYLDASLRYEFSEHARFTFGVENLLETDPPLLGNEQLERNTDPGRYDVYGRRFFVRFSVDLGVSQHS
ncbi:MAG: TonB-dependent receptor [Pseudomonadota bacterium]